MAVYRLIFARGGEVYRGLSIIEQAPLEGCKAPPSPLSFRLLLVVLWRILLFIEYLCLGLSIVGYLIPVCILAIVSSEILRLLSYVILISTRAFYSLVLS